MPEVDDRTARRALSIAAALGTADPGEKAEARRMDGRGSPLFWRQAARLALPLDQEAAWLRFTRLVALLTTASAVKSIHEPGRTLGAVLADGGNPAATLKGQPAFSEQRFARLLAARGDARAEALERAVRMIARGRPRLDVVDLAHTVLGHAGTRLARDYYLRLDRSPTDETEHA